MTKKLKTFKVIKTNKIKDSTGTYVRMGEMAQLTQELAEFYHSKGFVQVAMTDLYKDKNGGENGQDSEPAETEASTDGPVVAGEDKTEASPAPTSNRRRARASS